MKKVVIFTGAGMSAESGIPTFRGGDGLWDNYPVEQVATHEGYLADRKLVLDFFNLQRRKIWKAQPNEGHKQIVRLEEKYHVDVITQNIDNLHERAGSSHVLHLHGEVDKARSEKNDDLIVDCKGKDVFLGDLAPDGAQLRPHIVLFGEAVPNMEPAIEIVQKADYFVVIGTSLAVYPAASLLMYADSKVPTYLVDPHPAAVNSRIKVIAEPASTGVKKVVDELLAL